MKARFIALLAPLLFLLPACGEVSAEVSAITKLKDGIAKAATSLKGVTDKASAETAIASIEKAMPGLKEAAGKFDKAKLPEVAKTAFDGLIKGLPNIGDIVKGLKVPSDVMGMLTSKLGPLKDLIGKLKG